MKLKHGLPLMALFLLCLGNSLQAQQQEGQGRQQRQRAGQGQPRVSRTALLQIEAVQQELEVTDEQKTELDALRPNRQRGAGGEGRGGRRRQGGGADQAEGNDQAQGSEPGSEPGAGGGRGQRGRGQGGRTGGGAAALERVQAEITALQGILLEHQMSRLNEIYVQVAGPAALSDPVVVQILEISDEQRQKMQDVQQKMREQMRELAQSGDRESMREQIADMRKQANSDLVALLSDEQNAKLAKMKGAAFEMPEGAMQRPNRRGGQGGGDRADF